MVQRFEILLDKNKTNKRMYVNITHSRITCAYIICLNVESVHIGITVSHQYFRVNSKGKMHLTVYSPLSIIFLCVCVCT